MQRSACLLLLPLLLRQRQVARAAQWMLAAA
jgi:hypothetical protein